MGSCRCSHACVRQERAWNRCCVRFETAPALEIQFDWKGPVNGLIAASEAACTSSSWGLVAGALDGAGARIPEAAGDQAAELGVRQGGRRHAAAGARQPKTWSRCRSRTSSCIRSPRVLSPLRREPDPAWPHHPERKGKIERSLRDLDEEGVLDTTYTNLSELQAAGTASMKFGLSASTRTHRRATGRATDASGARR